MEQRNWVQLWRKVCVFLGCFYALVATPLQAGFATKSNTSAGFVDASTQTRSISFPASDFGGNLTTIGNIVAFAAASLLPLYHRQRRSLLSPRSCGAALRHLTDPTSAIARFSIRSSSNYTREAIAVVTIELSGIKIAARSGFIIPKTHRLTAIRL